MAINLPIISEWNPKGIDKAINDFKKLETKGEKASFAIKKAAVPATLALAAMGGFLVNAAKGAEEARQANQRLGNVLDSMGYGEATERVSAFAESLEKTVAVDADVIKATQTKLATFGKLTASVNEAGERLIVPPSQLLTWPQQVSAQRKAMQSSSAKLLKIRSRASQH
jgi:hypothetical protein